jgi:SsrA-binding protein
MRLAIVAGKTDKLERVAASNRRAFHDFFIDDKIEAGVVLLGPEVKSVRAHHVSLTEAHAEIRNGEVWLLGMHITPYAATGHTDLAPIRPRKLLLTKREIERLDRQVKQKGYTLVPLRIYFSDRGYAKVELGLARGKRQFDKREAIAERDAQRQVDRALREHEKDRTRRGGD